MPFCHVFHTKAPFIEIEGMRLVVFDNGEEMENIQSITLKDRDILVILVVVLAFEISEHRLIKGRHGG